MKLRPNITDNRLNTSRHSTSLSEWIEFIRSSNTFMWHHACLDSKMAYTNSVSELLMLATQGMPVEEIFQSFAKDWTVQVESNWGSSMDRTRFALRFYLDSPYLRLIQTENRYLIYGIAVSTLAAAGILYSCTFRGRIVWFTQFSLYLVKRGSRVILYSRFGALPLSDTLGPTTDPISLAYWMRGSPSTILSQLWFTAFKLPKHWPSK